MRMVTRAKTVKSDNGMPGNLISISVARIASGCARNGRRTSGSARIGGAKNEQLGCGISFSGGFRRRVCDFRRGAGRVSVGHGADR